MGGGGADFAELCNVSRTLARGCTSTSWVTAFYAIHNWMLVRCEDAVRSELLGGNGFVLAPAALAPTGRGKVVDGGYEPIRAAAMVEAESRAEMGGGAE